MKRIIPAALLIVSVPALAVDVLDSGRVQDTGRAAASTTIVLAQADTVMTDGEVRKVDKDTKKITLKHGEIKNLSMPAMTMVFQVKDPAMIDQVKVGDKVRFHAEQVNGAMVVTGIEPSK